MKKTTAHALFHRRCQWSVLLLKLGLVMFLPCIGVTAASGQQEYLLNGSFNADIGSWVLISENLGETMEWDGTMGSPAPGSLRLSVVSSSFIGPRAASECIAIPFNSEWELIAMAREEPGSAQLECGVALLLFDLEDCSDSSSALVPGNVPAATDWTLLTLGYAAVEEFRGMRVALGMAVGTSANGSCNFDSIRLLGPPSLAVPALDRTGLLTLVVVLAGAGVLLLRRQR